MTTLLLRASVVALTVLAPGFVLAQATGDDNETAAVVTEDDDGFNLGWLGLLGLAGLRRRDPVATVTTRSTTPH